MSKQSKKKKLIRETSLEVQGLQTEASTATAINLGRAMKCLSYQILLSESNVLNHVELHRGIIDECIRLISKHMVIDPYLSLQR